MELGISGKRFVVTGGSSGIGRAVVGLLQSEGAEVIVVDRSIPEGSVASVLCDLADPRSVRKACEDLPDEIDGLVNVAGASGATGPETAFGVNFLGLRLLTEELHDRITRGGSVVNVASTAGANWRRRVQLLREGMQATTWAESLTWFRKLGMDGTAAYDLSKELVIYYSQTIAHRRVDDDVRVNTVSPGPITTPLLSEFGKTMGTDSLDRIRSVVGRDGRPHEVAQAVIFLLSPLASWINGTDIAVDGGAEAAFSTGRIGMSRTGVPVS